jgi:hypothetical protein
MSHGKKSKRKKHKKHPEHTEIAEHLNKRPPHVDIAGRVEANFPPGLIEKYDTASDKEERWNHKKFAADIVAAILLAASVAAVAWQGFLLRESNKTNREALESAQRPWVGISGNDSFRLQLVKGEPLKVVLISKNFGTAPALKESSVNKMEEVPPPPLGHVPNFNVYTREEAGPPTVLFPGSASTIQVDTAKPSDQGNIVFAHLTDEEMRQIRTGIIRIYVFGSIWYEDTFHKAHRTDYCFMFNPETSSESTASFIACSDHNYAD